MDEIFVFSYPERGSCRVNITVIPFELQEGFNERYFQGGGFDLSLKEAGRIAEIASRCPTIKQVVIGPGLRTPLDKFPGDVTGEYDFVNETIYLSYGENNCYQTAWHELFHALDRNTLIGSTKEAYIFGSEQMPDLTEREAAARVFARWAVYGLTAFPMTKSLSLQWTSIKYMSRGAYNDYVTACLA